MGLLFLILVSSLFVLNYAALLSDQQTSQTYKATTEGLKFSSEYPEFENSVQRALSWLITQREYDWGWRNDTAKVLTALRLATVQDDSNPILPTQLETELSAKQLEIEIVILLWRHREIPITPPKLAQYSLAVSSLCKDPREFHGHDLIGTLQHHEPVHDLEFAYASLAACSAKSHVRKKQIRRLLDIANTAKDHNIDDEYLPPKYPCGYKNRSYLENFNICTQNESSAVSSGRNGITVQGNVEKSSNSFPVTLGHQDGKFEPFEDTVAMTILALRCIVKDHRHRNLQHSLRRPSISLARQQHNDGGFGNVYNTAITMQALHEVQESNSYWNRTAARAYIESRQDPDGAFTDPGLTADSILALSGKGLGAIRNLECGKSDSDFENHVEIDVSKSLSSHGNDSEIRNVTVTYTLWVGSNITENCTISITAPRNTSFYNIMTMAMELDPHFTFEASEWPNGHYVHTLAGYKEEPMGYHYWLLYRLPEVPDPSAPPANQLVAPVGVDELLIEDGDHYLFWYKKL